MPLVINTNIASLMAQNNLNKSQSALQTSLERLSSGLRINSAKDDAAGMAISSRMTSQINGLDQAVRNANDGISMAQTAEGALNQISDILQRLRTLAVQSANATNSNTDRQSMQAEAAQLKAELTRIAGTTTFNGQTVLDGSKQNIQFQVGADANQTIGISIGDARATSVGNNVVVNNNTNYGMAKATDYNRYATEGTAVGVTQSGASYTGISSNGYAAQTLTVRDAAGNIIENGSVGVNAGDQASTIAARLNQLQGVHATAYNQLKLANLTSATSAETITATISSGSTSVALSLSGVDSSSSQSAIFTALENGINGNASLQAAGVTAGLDASGNIVIRNNTGADLGAGLQLANTLSGSAMTVDAYGSDSNNTQGVLSVSSATQVAERVGGQMNIFLANGYSIASSKDGSTASGTGIFNAAANTAVTASETNVGINDVLSGNDTSNRVNTTGLGLGYAEAAQGTVASVATAAGAAGVTGAVQAQTLKILDSTGTVVNGGTITVATGSSAKTIAGQLNALSGVTATASSQLTLSDYTHTTTSFGTLTVTVGNGTTNTALTLSSITSSSTANDVYTALADAINQNSTLTGEGYAAALDASGNLSITNSQGQNIGVGVSGNVSSGTATGFTVTGSDPAATQVTIADASGTTTSATMVQGKVSVALAAGETIQSSVAGNTQSAGGLFDVGANVKATAAVTSVNYGNSVAAQTLTVDGTNGTANVSVQRDSSAQTIASLINAQTTTTGVTATASTTAKLTDISAAGTIGFTLYGTNTTGVAISAAVTGSGSLADLTSLASAINAQSSNTGITASLTDNNSSILLTQADGADIKIVNFTNSAASGPTSSNISGTAASMQVIGETNSVSSSGAITTTATNATTLYAGGVTDSGQGSTVVGGTLSLSSSSAFDVKSSVSGSSVALVGGNSSLFSTDANVANTSGFSSINGVDVSTVQGANNALSVIDAALNQVNSILGNLGAVQNRFNFTIAALSSASTSIAAARSRIQDTNYAAETANLTRNQILQQAGVAMLAQSNQLPQLVLSLLK